jgi:hypothetical protein
MRSQHKKFDAGMKSELTKAEQAWMIELNRIGTEEGAGRSLTPMKNKHKSQKSACSRPRPAHPEARKPARA